MKKYYITGIFIYLSVFSYAQPAKWKYERMDIFVGAGANLFLGDLGGGSGDAQHYFSIKDIDWKNTRPTLQAGIRYRIWRDLSVRPYVSYARLRGDDAESQNLGRKARNLHFRSDLLELGTQFEYYFIKEKNVGRYVFSSYRGYRFSSYLSLGGGGIWFNPKSESVRGAGDWTALQPMENENTSYSLFAAYLSLGIGVKYMLDYNWAIGLNIGFRYTTSDYIDDIHDKYSGKPNGFSDRHLLVNYDKEIVLDKKGKPYAAGTPLRGNPKYNDAYMFMMITAYYKIQSGYKNNY